MISKYHDPILKLILDNGPMGVNALAKQSEIPLSTLQKYLDKQQTYFKKTPDRKWDLPENVTADIKNTTLTLMTNVIENTILMLQSQLNEALSGIDNVLAPLGTLRKGIENIQTPVAGHTTPIDRRLLELDKKANDTMRIFKSHISNVPEQYKSLILNLDYIGLVLKKDDEVVNGEFGIDITSILLGKSDAMSDETLSLLKEFQKGE